MQKHQIQCPHCGAHDAAAKNPWSEYETGYAALICAECGQPLRPQPTAPLQNDKDTGHHQSTWKFWTILILLGGLIFLLNQYFHVLSFKGGWGQLIYISALVLLITMGITFGNTRRRLKHLTVWITVFLTCLIGYSYRFELIAVKEKVLAHLIPERGMQKSQNSMSFPMASDGHYYIRAQVNGISIRFLVDTGASHIVLTPEIAQRLGFDLEQLNFDRFYHTANGTVRGSSVWLSEFKMGSLHLKKIKASVNEAPMQTALLGMTFFKRLKKYEVKDQTLTVYW